MQGLQACAGISKDYLGCNTQQCPFWGEWGPWSPCLKFCDSGLKTRNRNCFGGPVSKVFVLYFEILLDLSQIKYFIISNFFFETSKLNIVYSLKTKGYFYLLGPLTKL